MYYFDSAPAAGRLHVKGVITDREFFEEEIRRFKCSAVRREMLTGERYYDGRHDILRQKRMVIGEGGDAVELKNLPNNRVVDNQYRRMVNQKANYLMGRPVDFRSDNPEYAAKSLQDGLNAVTSAFQNGMEEDCRNTIMVLVNYDGENLAEFRQKLAAYGAVKVRTVDGAPGDVKTLKVEVNAENYRAIIDIFRRAIIENAMGYDAKDERLLGSPNQMRIKNMYSDIDLDANGMECEFQAGFEELFWFIDRHFLLAGRGDFTGERMKLIFNRDTIVNEGDVIDNLMKSRGLISDETLVALHPWVEDWQREMERIRAAK